MFMTIISFAIMAILFVIISFFLEGVWPYYVPVTLTVLSIWLKVIQLSWDNQVDKLQMPITKMDPSAAAGYVWIIAVIYAIVSAVLGNWVPFFLCIGVFILAMTMKFDHPFDKQL